MKREKAIKLLVNATYSSEWQGNEELTTARNMAIKALEAEPILDKVKAEILKLDDINPDYPMDRTVHVSRNEVLGIIDKYKAQEVDE